MGPIDPRDADGPHDVRIYQVSCPLSVIEHDDDLSLSEKVRMVADDLPDLAAFLPLDLLDDRWPAVPEIAHDGRDGEHCDDGQKGGHEGAPGSDLGPDVRIQCSLLGLIFSENATRQNARSFWDYCI